MFQVVINTAGLGSLYVLFALGLTLMWGVLDLLNLAYGATFMIAAYVGYLSTVHLSINIFSVIAVGIVTGALGSFFADVLVFRNIRRRISKATGEGAAAMMVASIGLAAIPVTIVEQGTSVAPVRIPLSTFQVRPFHLGPAVITNIQVIMIAVAIVLTVCLYLVIQRTRAGRAVRGVAVDPGTCELLGVNTSAVFAWTMLVGGGLAGLAGVLLSIQLDYIDSSLGSSLLLKAFAIIILGGVGSIPGAVIGGYLLALAETLTVYWGQAAYQDAISFVLIIIILVVRPTGLLPRLSGARA